MRAETSYEKERKAFIYPVPGSVRAVSLVTVAMALVFSVVRKGKSSG